MTKDELKSRLEYLPEEGKFLWVKPSGVKKKPGSVAGGKLSDGYWGIRIDNVLYRAHRLAWLYMTGEWPRVSVDHIDRNPLNNRWSNLREASQAQNAQNTKREAKGWYMRDGKYRARIRLNFKYVNLGTFKSAEEAHAAYKAAKVSLHPFYPAEK